MTADRRLISRYMAAARSFRIVTQLLIWLCSMNAGNARKVMRRDIFGRLAPGLVVGLILAVSLALRIWGSGYGLPSYTRYHPDEHALVDRAAAILWTGDWNLHRFNYPAFYAYLQAVAYALYFLWGAAQGQWDQLLPVTLPQYYQVGRLLTALMGTLTVLVVYLAGRQLRGRRAGLAAAALMGGCYLHIIHSHYATFDVMVGLLAILTLLFSLLAFEQPNQRWYFLAGLMAGLAGATKYNGGAVIAVVLVLHILVTPWGDWGWLNRRLLAGVGGFLIGFFGGNPFALGNLPDFLTGLATVLHHYGTEQPGFEGTGNWRWYLSIFIKSADRFWFIAGVLGFVGMLWRDWKRGLLLITFPLVYYAMVSRFVVRFERNMVPLLPFLAVAGGWLLTAFSELLAQRLRPERKGRWSGVLACAFVGLVIALPLVAGVLFDISISRTDLREKAGQWVEAHVDGGTRIAVEHYSVPFDDAEYRVQDVMRISDHDLAWYQDEGFGVLVISDGVWGLLLRQPDVYADKVKAYEELTNGTTLLAEFVPQPPGLVVAGYPTVAIYHFAPTRVYGLP